MRAALAVAVVAAAMVPSGARAQEPPPAPEAGAGTPSFAPGQRDNGVELDNSALRRSVRRLERGQEAGPGVVERGGRILVEVSHRLSDAAATTAIQRVGGRVDGRVPGVLVQALVPADRLEDLEATPGISAVRPPRSVSAPPPEQARPEAVAGEQLRKTGAWLWHRAGQTGAGVKVGIIDVFGGGQWSSAQAAGDLPSPAGTFCRWDGRACDVWAFNHPHGSAVAEIVHEMAPGAQLYLATVHSTADLQAAVEYFDSRGVRIISRSLTAEYDGPGNGTGPIARVIDNAVARGIAWIQSAGNSAGAGNRPGAYWRGSWRDVDGDAWLEFSPNEEVVSFRCGYFNGLRWNDFGPGVNATNYDIYIWDEHPLLVAANPEARSENFQGVGGAEPIETLQPRCSGQNDTDYLAIRRHSAGNGSAGDILEVMTNTFIMSGHWSVAHSASGPAADTRSNGALVVGAIDPPLGTAIAAYSSQGPTNDMRVKPDISAASCVRSHSYSPGCFDGTSASTPVVAGAAALVRGAVLATSPSAIRNWLLLNATVDRGVAGTDNVFGRGEMILPAFQPDNHIRHAQDADFVGNDTYSDTAPGQTRAALVRRGAGATFYIRAQNDGTRSEPIRMAGTGSVGGYTVSYLSGTTGTTDITAAVVAGTYRTPTLAPGQTHTIRMRLTLSASVTSGRNFLVTSLSTHDVGRRDRVSAVITPFS